MVSTPAFIWEVPGLNLSQEIGILIKILWFSPVPPGKLWDFGQYLLAFLKGITIKSLIFIEDL
jgi:hypothetical protein